MIYTEFLNGNRGVGSRVRTSVGPGTLTIAEQKLGRRHVIEVRSAYRSTNRTFGHKSRQRLAAMRASYSCGRVRP